MLAQVRLGVSEGVLVLRFLQQKGLVDVGVGVLVFDACLMRIARSLPHRNPKHSFFMLGQLSMTIIDFKCIFCEILGSGPFWRSSGALEGNIFLGFRHQANGTSQKTVLK